MAKKRYSLIGLGGTFDHFHDGHRHFIQYAAELGERLLVGVSQTSLIRHKPFGNQIENYSIRQAAVKQFCHQARIPVEVVPLTDPYGPTLEDSPVKALCVTPETSPGADKINTLRTKLGLRPLPTFVSDYALASNGEPIHSLFIRQGRMNRHGFVYQQLFESTIQLSDAQRGFFSQLQGPLITTRPAAATFSAVVGDTSLEWFISQKWAYDLGVYDQRTLRQPHQSPILSQLTPDIQVTNPAGQLTTALVQSLHQAIQEKVRHLLVTGEEDIATVALVLLAPLGSVIYYGQKDQGMVALTVTEELKDRFAQQFTFQV